MASNGRYSTVMDGTVFGLKSPVRHYCKSLKSKEKGSNSFELEPFEKWSGRQDLNLRPLRPER